MVEGEPRNPGVPGGLLAGRLEDFRGALGRAVSLEGYRDARLMQLVGAHAEPAVAAGRLLAGLFWARQDLDPVDLVDGILFELLDDQGGGVAFFAGQGHVLGILARGED